MKKMFVIISIVFMFMAVPGSVFADNETEGTGTGGNGSEKITCQDYKDLTSNAWFIIRVAAPALLIVYGAIDMGKAVMGSDEKEIKKAIDTFVKRIVICIAIFLLPTIVDLIMGIMEYGKIGACL